MVNKPTGGILSKATTRRVILIVVGLIGIYLTLKVVSSLSSGSEDNGNYNERWVRQCLSKLGGSHAGAQRRHRLSLLQPSHLTDTFCVIVNIMNQS